MVGAVWIKLVDEIGRFLIPDQVFSDDDFSRVRGGPVGGL